MTEVCRWCRFETLLCRPVVAVSRDVGVADALLELAVEAMPAVSLSDSRIAGWAEGAREEVDDPCAVLCMFLPRVTEASLDWGPFAIGPDRYCTAVFWSVLSYAVWKFACSGRFCRLGMVESVTIPPVSARQYEDSVVSKVQTLVGNSFGYSIH